jgi:Icc-related predicted phosphoesterase
VTECFFSSDLHGSVHRYRRLAEAIAEGRPRAVFLGGDLFPSGLVTWKAPEAMEGGFLSGFLIPDLRELKVRMGPDYPRVFLILGNDDMREEEGEVRRAEEEGIWTYSQGMRHVFGEFQVYGYAYVPPTPFLWKDWERYDVSRYVPPGCVSPEEGWRSVEVSPHEVRYGTIKEDLQELAGDSDLARSVFLFHTPPHETKLDRAGLDGKMVDYVPLDLHVGSIALRRFIEARQPLLTLHGHIHESARLTGSWKDQIGRTHMFSGAHDGPELALIRFDLEDLAGATRTLL